MTRVLYLSNIEVPYRVRFFNELAKYCELTVMYERENSANRDKKWAASEERRFKVQYLKGISVGNESAFSLKILKTLRDKYDVIVVGCYNSPVQMLMILALKVLCLPYFINVDGEAFFMGNGFKKCLKRFFLRGATGYLVAGEKASEQLKYVAGNAPVFPYYFSSLSKEELAQNANKKAERAETVLIVGQYFDYKGLDVALEAARMDSSISYKFVGMGRRTELFCQECRTNVLPNVEVIPFLQKQELEREYQTCAMLVLPSRQECWGLVINEAASFGTPIVSTWGSGAAVEFLANQYPQYLAKADDPEDLLKRIKMLKGDLNKDAYGVFLQNKTQKYSIDESVRVHVLALGCGKIEKEKV